MRSVFGVHYKIPDMTPEQATSHLGRKWGWLLVAGIAYTLLGMIAFSTPIASTVALTFVVAGLLVARGIVHLFEAFKLSKEQGAMMRFLQSLLSLACGAFIFLYPKLGMIGISLTLGFYFIIAGVMQWMLSAAMSSRTRLWGYASSIVSILIGFYIVFSFPLSAAWVPGKLLAIELFFTGASLIGFAFTVRKAGEKTTEVGSQWRPTNPAT